MQYTDTIDESRQYLRLSLELIGKHGLPTDPLNYCVWYEYATGRNECLNVAIDNHINDNCPFTEEISRQIFNQCIAANEQKITAQIQDQLRKIFSDIIGEIKTTNQHYSQSNQSLELMQHSLIPSLSEADLQMIVAKIREEITSLESTNQSFKEQLQQARSEIDELKNKLTRYREESIKDPLTRIYNRGRFEKKLINFIHDANETGNSLCLILADIDHFKKFNDTHGHLVGDNVLRMVATTIKESIKGRDLPARIGGEEFAVLLPDTPYEGALKLANDLRLAFERLDLRKRNTGENIGKITLSFGVTRYHPQEAPEDFINRADDALYISKKGGRNRVTGK